MPFGIVGIAEVDAFHGADYQQVAYHRHDRGRCGGGEA